MRPRKLLSKRIGFGIDDEIDVVLLVQRDVFRAMMRDRRHAHFRKQAAKQFGIWGGVLDKFESIRAHRVLFLCHCEIS